MWLVSVDLLDKIFSDELISQKSGGKVVYVTLG